MKTIINLFEESVNKFSNNTYLLEKINDKYEPATYIKVREQVYIFAAGLIALGIKKVLELHFYQKGEMPG